MSSETLQYMSRRINGGEEVTTGKYFTRLTGIFFGKKEQLQWTAGYAYVRHIEDHIDNGTDPESGERLLEREVQRVKKLINNETDWRDNTLACHLLEEVENGLSDNKKIKIFRPLMEIVGGMRLDNLAIRLGRPLPVQVQKQRDLFESMSGFEIVSQLLFNRELFSDRENSEGIKNLFRSWIRYDALRDLDEDLSAGLILFSQKELDTHSVQLNKGQPVPKEMKNMFKDQKISVIPRLAHEAKNIFKTNLPEPFVTFLWAYFFTRQFKLMKAKYPVKEIIFAGNNINSKLM